MTTLPVSCRGYELLRSIAGGRIRTLCRPFRNEKRLRPTKQQQGIKNKKTSAAYAARQHREKDHQIRNKVAGLVSHHGLVTHTRVHIAHTSFFCDPHPPPPPQAEKKPLEDCRLDDELPPRGPPGEDIVFGQLSCVLF